MLAINIYGVMPERANFSFQRSLNRGLLGAISAALLLLCAPASAQETQPGNPCSVANQTRFTGGPENSGTVDLLRCNGSAWQSQVRFSSAGWTSIGTLDGGVASSKLTINKDWQSGGDEWQVGIRANAETSGASASYRGVAAIEANATVSATGTWHDASGFSANVQTANDGVGNQGAYGFHANIVTHPGDYGYGLSLANTGGPDATGGTFFGIFINITDPDVTSYGIYQESNNNNRLNGRLGFSTSSPSYRLELPNSTTNGVGRGIANQWAVHSDGRFKTEVKPITDALDKVGRLSGVTYVWTHDKDGPREMGFIAQDVRAVVPEIVSVSSHTMTAEDGKETTVEDYHAMDYSRIGPLLVEAVKELRAEVRNLRAEVDELKTTPRQ